MISTMWIEERYTEPDGLVVHKTIALHGEICEGMPLETRVIYVKHDVFTPHFVKYAYDVEGIFNYCMLKRMHKIIMEISGSPTGE